MHLSLRKVIHPQAGDNYRVVLHDTQIRAPVICARLEAFLPD
jgi:hypothetical protein